MTQNSFPTEFIELPSKGHFYPEDNPLSSGKVEMKYMTAKEEDILTSVNLIQQGVVLDKLLETLVIDKSINLDDILIGDKNALIVGARILAYGKDYEFNYIDSLGDLRTSVYQQSPKMEGTLLFFPSRLHHEVHPYYECDEQRISISGNIWLKDINK